MAVKGFVWTERGVQVEDDGLKEVEIMEFEGAKRENKVRIVVIERRLRRVIRRYEINFRKRVGEFAREQRREIASGATTNRSSD